MFGIGNRLEEVLVSAWASDALGGTGILSAEAVREFDRRRRTLLDRHVMVPAVAEVVLKEEPVMTAERIGHDDAGLVDFVVFRLVVRGAVDLVPDFEEVQVRVSPTHRYQQDLRQVGHGDFVRHEDPAPHGRLDITQLHSNLQRAFWRHRGRHQYLRLRARVLPRPRASFGGTGRHAETPAVLTKAERGGCSPLGGGTARVTPGGLPRAARVGGSAKARLLRSRQSRRSWALASR